MLSNPLSSGLPKLAKLNSNLYKNAVESKNLPYRTTEQTQNLVSTTH